MQPRGGAHFVPMLSMLRSQHQISAASCLTSQVRWCCGCRTGSALDGYKTAVVAGRARALTAAVPNKQAGVHAVRVAAPCCKA